MGRRCFKTWRRKINNLCYADNIILIAENAKDLQAVIMKVKEQDEKMDLMLNKIVITTGIATSLVNDSKDIEE